MEGATRKRPIVTPTVLLFVMVAVMVIAGLLLPPVSLAKRLFKTDYSRLTAEASQVSHPDGLTLQLDAASVKSVSVKLESIPRSEFLDGAVPEAWQPAVAALPPNLSLKSPVYVITARGEVNPPIRFVVAIPNDAEPYSLLDLYAWHEGAWRWAPSSVEAGTDQVVCVLDYLPSGLALMQAGAVAPVIGLRAEPGDILPPEVTGLVTELYPGGLYLGPGGVLLGGPASLGAGAAQYAQFATSRSTNPQSVQTLLTDPARRQAHLTALTNLVVGGGYAGLNLDYPGMTAPERTAFAGMVGELATQLRASGRALVITVPSPTQTAPGTWDTAGYDWTALAGVADRLLVTLNLDPKAYAKAGSADQMLAWAVSQVNRYQLLAAVHAGGVQDVGGILTPIDGGQALAPLSSTLARLDGGPAELEPGSQVVVGIPAGLVEQDPVTGGYHVSSQVDGQTVTTWLPGGSTLQQRLQVISGYHLGGFVLDGLTNSGIVNELVSAVNTFLAATVPPGAETPVLTWAVQDGAGGLLGVLVGDLADPQFAWQAADAPGAYTILGQLAFGQQVADLGAVQVVVVQPQPTATPAPQPTETPAAPQATATASAPPVGDADAVIAGDVVNVREGPGTVFRRIGSLTAGTTLDVLAVNPEQTWLRISAADGTTGWVLAQLCTVYVRLADQPVETVPTPTPAPTNTPGASAPVLVAPPAGGAFELGGHIRTWNYMGQMASARMSWVKVQVHYGENASGLVASAHGAGFKIQLSALGSKDMVNQANFHGDYGAWVAGMAAAGADAIEVWNEPNIDAEWPLGQISPSAYTQLLCASYNAIKGANAGTAVISAAPAPTGYFGGCSANGCDDLPWIQGMYSAGAANCMDYLGAHHNAGATSPSARSGHPADNGGGHHSWYFLPQTQLYYQTFGGARKLFYTEMGYASQEGVPSFSDWFGWARGTDNAEQAAWLAEAVSLSRSTGMVRCIIVWNIDFARYGDDPQDGYAIIRPDGSCPACGPLAAAMGY